MATEAGDARGVANAATLPPDDGSQYTTAIEWIAGKEVEYCQQQITGPEEEEKRDAEIKLHERAEEHSCERD